MRWLALVVLFTSMTPTLQAQSRVDSLKSKLMQYEIQEQVRQELREEHEQWRKELQNELIAVRLAKQHWYDSVAVLLSSVTAVFATLSLFGFGAITWARKRFEDKLQELINKAIYKVDARDMPINVPETGMEKQVKRLEELGFNNLTQYSWLDDRCIEHAVLYFAEDDAKVAELVKFIENKGLSEKEDVVFVVYTKGAQIERQLFKRLSESDNVTFANNHLTLIQALFVAARGLVH